MSAPATIAKLAKVIDPAVRKVFVDTYKQVEPKLDKIFKVEDAVDFNEQEQNITGMGSLNVVAEGENYKKDAPIQSYGVTYTQVKYGKIGEITYETKKFAKTNINGKMPRMGAKAAVRKIEEEASGVFNHGFSSSYTSYGDGSALFGTHTRADGGASQSNYSSGAIALTESNLEVAQLASEAILDDRGQAIDMFATKLLVPPALRKEAMVITKSALRSGTANNDMNVYSSTIQSMKAATMDELIVWKYLASYLGGSDDAWFLLSDEHQIKWKWGEKPVIVRMTDENKSANDTIEYKVRMFASHGWSDFRGAWGSAGA